MGDNQSFFIGGVRVHFPVNPYPPQKAMMAQIIKGLNRNENCLLESPTGTGKSLALLCSTLAWQEAEEDRVQRYNALISEGITDPDILGQIFTTRSFVVSDRTTAPTEPLLNQPQTSTSHQDQPLQAQFISNEHQNQTNQTETGSRSEQTPLEGGFVRDEDTDDFKDVTSRFRIREGTADESMGLDESSSLNQTTDTIVPSVDTNQPRRKRTPKIYFGTRTHKQIFQIIKELRTTKYRNISSVVLGSREHTCIHPIVSKSRNKNEGCKTLLEKKNDDFCSYYHNASRIKTHDQLANYGLSSAWDLEDLVKLGKKARACPYFVSRHLMETAQIIFCPYNYLIDPMIRKAMSIDLQNAILVLDEAHNVEDCSREAASFSLTQDELFDARNDLENLSYDEAKSNFCQPLIQMLSSLSRWMEANKENLTDYSEFGRTGKIFTGQEMLQHLKHLDIDPKTVSHLLSCLHKLNEDSEQEEEFIKPSAATTHLISGLFLIFKFMFKDDMKNVDDYKIALVKTQTFSRGFKKDNEGWMGRLSTSFSSFIYRLNFWCLNPGVSFSELDVMTRTIILSSGTLSPMNSFESELQVKFHIKLEANHVIKRDQVWVGTISTGPTNISLKATYKHSETLAFQDELGRVVLDLCEAVPRGVLCFLPSYAMLDKLIERWQSSLLWEQIKKTKVLIIEPRNSEEFENAIKRFYQAIEDTRDWKEGNKNGALFIAVCRGKVSEGLDFKDDNARAVIVVGIPFPNFKDIQVNLKRNYNDKYSKTKGLLSGSEWYEIQAYRALNQALGRCIRHKCDWGAIILVDERYQNISYGNPVSSRYVRGLSKWVRNCVQHEPSFSGAISQLKQFAKRMMENANNDKYEISEPKSKPAMLLPKPKFISPPVFQKFGEKHNERNEKETPNFPFGSEKTDENRVNCTNLVFHFKDGNYEITKPQNALLLTPVKDNLGLPLTPISGSPFTLPQSPEILFPLSSTQIPDVCHPNYPDNKIIGFVHRQNNSELNSLSTPETTPARKLSSKLKDFPIFVSANKKRKKRLGSHSSYPKDDLLTLNSNVDRTNDSEDLDSKYKEKENALSYLSDDLFGDDDCLSTSAELKQINLNEKTDEEEEEEKPKISAESKKSSSNRQPFQNKNRACSAQKLALSSVDGEDSDFDDFDLNTSFVGSSVKRRVSKGKRTYKGAKPKGIVFTNYD